MAAADVVRHHFDLSYFKDEPNDLRFHVGTEQFPVSRHDRDSLAQAADGNAVIGMMTAPQCGARITHFADVPAEHLPQRQIRRLKLSYDDGDRRFKLRSVAWYGTYIPPQYRRRYRIRASKRGRLTQPLKLEEFGIAPVASERMADLMAHVDLIGTATDTAISIVSRHPQLGTTFAPSAACIESHIEADDNKTALRQLSDYITQNPNTYQTKENPLDPTTNPPQPYVFEYDLGPFKQGEKVEQFALADETLKRTGAAIVTPLRLSNDDPQLRNQSWSVQHGRPANHGAAARSARRAAARKQSGAGGAKVTLTTTDLSTSWGLTIGSPNYDDTDKSLSIGITNNIQRTVCGYVEFLDPSGTPIVPPNWTSRLGFLSDALETSTTKYLGPISPQIVAMGIPIYSLTTTLSFPWPETASTARLILGSMGATQWNKPYSVPGAVLTGVFNFGFPMLFLTAGAANVDAKWFTSLLDSGGGLVVIGAGEAVVLSLIIGGDELDDLPQVLATFGTIVVGLMGKAVLQAIMSRVVAWLTEAELVDSIPIVGQGIRLIAVVGYTAQLAEAAAEVFQAPATMIVEMKRTFTVTVGVSPDPRHGLPGKPETAVWPALGDTYQVTVQYRGGVSWVQTGKMPPSESGTPLSLTFDDMPAGGSLQVVVAIRSSNGWLCGTWTSDWHDAMPSNGELLTGSGSLAVNGSITEQLAPLTADATYSFNQSIVYDPTGGPKGSGGHAWVNNPPTGTTADLCTGTQVGLGALVGLTVLEKTYSAGYVWMGYPLNPNAGASGKPAVAQAYCYQGLSLINDPDMQLVTPNSVTAEQSAVFYEKFGPAAQPGGPPPYNYLVDPSTGALNLTAVDLSGSPPGPVQMQPPGPTWGAFPGLKYLADAVVHPSGYVVGISSTTHKLPSLTLPNAAATRATGSALAQMSSNQGTRQGLVDTPVALDICPDGTILVLEQGNQRVQAFDAHANPVPAFDEKLLFTAAGKDITGDLDEEKLPAAPQTAFTGNAVSKLFSMPAGVASALTPGTASQALLDAFTDGDTLISAATTVSAGSAAGQWTMADPQTGQSYGVVANSTVDGFDVFHIFGSDATVTARVPGTRWTISDPAGSAAYDIKINPSDSSKIDVYSFVSTFQLHPTADGTAATCLDVAVEPSGYVYVLTHTGHGDQISDFALDIYTPEGIFMNRTGSGDSSGFVGAKIAVDIWRNLFTLDYQKTVGPFGQSEPTTSQWVPTPPVGTLDQSYSTAFANNDTGTVLAALQTAGIKVASTISIKQVSPSGHWQVIGPPDYDVLLSAQSTQPVGGNSAPPTAMLYVYALAGS